MNVQLPDGSIREVPDGATVADVAASIGRRLAKDAIAGKVDGKVVDVYTPVPDGAKVEIVTPKTEAGLDTIRHSTAHLMAMAVQELFPGTQVTIGPVIENGFYYDFYRDEPFSTEDFPRIEAKMREIIARDLFRGKGEDFKVELVDAIPEDQDLKIYFQGDWFDLCRGPHMPSTGRIGDAFKLMKVAGAYWRGDSNNPMLTRIYGTAWRSQEELDAYVRQLEEAEKRDHRRLGREMDLFHFQEEGPGVVFWHPKGWTLFQELVSYMRRRLKGDYSEVNAPQVLDKALWETSGHWGWYRDNMFMV